MAKTTKNSRPRNVDVDAVVLHAIGGPYCGPRGLAYSLAPGSAKQWHSFFERHPVLGIHYIIDRSGVVLGQIDTSRVANHTLGWNENSIGIELVNDGNHIDEYTDLQMKALRKLILRLQTKYPLITKQRVFRHSDLDERIIGCLGVNIKRKQDPGVLFDYETLIKSLK